MNKTTINKVKEKFLKNNYISVREDTNRGVREDNYVPVRESTNRGVREDNYVSVRVLTNRGVRVTGKTSTGVPPCGISLVLFSSILSLLFVPSRTTRVLLIIIIMLFGLNARSQNINIPNITGPMDLEVNSYSGNLYFERTDFVIPGVELDLEISFSYNSFDYTINKGFGNGWSFGYNIYYETISPEKMLIIWDDGREDTCYALGGGNYQPPAGFFYTLKEYEPGKFSITEKSGLQYLFENSTTKKLTKITTPNGNFISFSYSGDKLSSLTNNLNQTLTFSYNAGGQLQSVTDAIAAPTRVWSYAYDKVGNLTKVTDPLGGKDEYTYLINGPMQTVKDKNQNVVDLVYYPNYALKEIVGCNKRMSFSYDEKQLLTVVTDHIEGGENQVNKYYYTKLEDNRVFLKSLSSNCCGIDVVLEYDEQGNKIEQTDANGNATRYTYDEKGNVLTITDALNQTVTLTYTPGLSRIKTLKDAKGNTTTFDYDANGNLTKITDPDGGSYTATYDENGNIASSTNREGKTFTYTYDSYGKLQSATGPDGKSISGNVTPRGDLTTLTDTKNNTQSYTYDILGRLTQVTDALNSTYNIGYDAIGNTTSVVDKAGEMFNFGRDASNRIKEFSFPLGAGMKIDYDGMDNVTGVYDAEGGFVRYEYDKRNLLSVIRDAEGNETTFNYDRKGNLITQNMPSGLTLTYTYDNLDRIKELKEGGEMLASVEYDANDNITKYTDGLGAIYQYEYDKLNRVIKITDPLNNSSELEYAESGQIKTISDRSGKSLHLMYDDYGRIVSFTDQNNSTTTVGYDSEGNIVSLKDANGNITNYTYDALNRLKKSTFPDGKYTENTYDATGNIISFRNKDGNNIQLSYDALSRPISKTLPGGEVYSYTYDKTGRVSSATNSTGTVEFGYDVMGRLISEKSQGREVNYGYNVSGRTQTTVYPDSTVVMKTFDNRNQLISIQKDNVPVVNYEHNNAGQVTSMSYANGVRTNYQYDFAGRLEKVTAGDLQSMEYTYDQKGNITSIIRGETDQSEFYTYDDANRLLTYKKGKSGGPYSVNDSYTYDPLGNRISAFIGGKNMTYTTNSLNQIVSMNDGAKTTNFQYDDNGNLTFDGKYYKTYDAEKRLIRDYASPTEDITYTYDVAGRRISRTVNGATTFYTYSGLNAIEERNGDDDIINQTFFSGFLNPVVNEKDGVPYYYHQNHLWSIDKMTDGSGNLSEQYRYDAYGRQTIYDATGNEIRGSITGNRYGFTGQVYDSATGHNQFFFRSYNPATGLFDQQDLIGYGDGMGMYQYVGNNPANGVDIMGLYPCNQEKTITIIDDKTINTYLSNYSGVTSIIDLKFSSEREMVEGLEKQMKQRIGKESENLIKRGSKGRRARQSLRKFSKASNKGSAKAGRVVGGVGKVLGGIDVAIKTGQLAESAYDYSNGTIDGADMAVPTVNLVQSVAGFTPQGAVYNLGDFLQSLVTKKTINEWSAEYGDVFGRAGYGDEDEELLKTMRESFNTKEEYEIWYKKWRRSEINKEIKIRRRYIEKTTADECPQGPSHGTRKDPPGASGNSAGQTEIIRSNDPNEMIGPDGKPDKRWVSVKDRLPYTVLFENSAEASAPAKYIKVVVPVDEKMDPATFHLSEIGFNNQTFSLPSAVSSNYQRLDARDSLGLFVDMTAGFDVAKNEFFWEFRSIDPVTMLPPDDPLKGFLLLQDTTVENSRSGHGFINFSIKPVTDARTLDSVLAKADIVFDQNEIIPTNIEHNIIDAVAPSAQMSPLAATYDHEITLSWSGQDDPNGSGVQYYTLYISTDGINFSILKDKMTRTDTTFTGPGEQTYYFFVLATDSVGNVAETDPGGVRSAYLGIEGAVPLNWLYFQGRTKGTDNQLEWATANEHNTREFRVERAFDTRNYKEIGIVKAAGNTTGNTSYSYTDHGIDKLGESDMYYRLAQVDMDGNTRYSTVIRLNYQGVTASKTIVYPNPTRGQIVVVPGDRSLIGSMAEVYDEAGKLLQRVKITSLHQQFDLVKYTNGIYLIRLANKEVLRVMKH